MQCSRFKEPTNQPTVVYTEALTLPKIKLSPATRWKNQRHARRVAPHASFPMNLIWFIPVSAFPKTPLHTSHDLLLPAAGETYPGSPAPWKFLLVEKRVTFCPAAWRIYSPSRSRSSSSVTYESLAVTQIPRRRRRSGGKQAARDLPPRCCTDKSIVAAVKVLRNGRWHVFFLAWPISGRKFLTSPRKIIVSLGDGRSLRKNPPLTFELQQTLQFFTFCFPFFFFLVFEGPGRPFPSILRFGRKSKFSFPAIGLMLAREDLSKQENLETKVAMPNGNSIQINTLMKLLSRHYFCADECRRKN